jgi:prepilin-type N-terminal cleavage/methylation domain-containing protein
VWTLVGVDRRSGKRGFTLIEVVIALGILSILLLASVYLTNATDRANEVVRDQTEAEHSGQATMAYVLRELQTAKNYYFDQAGTNSIGYRRADGSLSRIMIWNDLLIRQDCGSNPPFTTAPSTAAALPANAVVLSDGINFLNLTYTKDGVTALPPASADPSMFYVIRVRFSVTVGNATVSLESSAFTLNIEGQLSGLYANEVK